MSDADTDANTLPPPTLTSLRGAAEFLGCSKRHIERLVAAGELPAVRPGGRIVRIRISDLRDYITAPAPKRR